MSRSAPRWIRRQSLIFILALPIVVGSTWLSSRSLREFQQSDSDAIRTRQFLVPWTNLLINLRRAESSARGYLLTGSQSFLKPYRNALPLIASGLNDIQVYSSQVPEQTSRAATIRQLTSRLLGQLSESIALYDLGDRTAALDRSRLQEEDDVMSRIASLMFLTREFERQHLTASYESGAIHARNTFLASTIGNILILVFLGFAAWAIEKENRRRERDEVAIGELNDRLTRELSERTTVLESIRDGFCAFDSKCNLTYANPAAEGMLGPRHGSLTGKSCDDLLGTATSKATRESVNQAWKERIASQCEVFLIGYGRWFRIRFYPASDAGFTMYFSDITERKETDNERDRLHVEVEEARTLLDTFFENAPVGFGFWDRDLRFLRVNRAFATANGIQASQHIGKTVSEVLPRIDPGVLQSFRDVLDSGMSITRKEITGFSSAQPDKERTWIVSFYPIRIQDKTVGAGAIWEEVTERKAMEQSMRQAAKLESLGVLAGGIAHDFNNLLTGILGNASLATDLIPANHPSRTALGDVVAASERAAHLTRQLLAYAGKGRFVLGAVNLSALVREIAGLVHLSIPRNVQLRLELSNDVPNVMADSSQLQQLIMNLVINGAEAIPASLPGSVEIVTGSQDVDEHYLKQSMSMEEIKPGRYVFLEVHDTGVGMDQATIARIFDPFFTTKFTGRGLGLAAVLGIVRGHKGSLKVYSAPGRGTTFKILIPEAVEAVAQPNPSAISRDLKGSGLVLVIDDEEVIRRTTKATLERYGYTVALAENGGAGLEYLETGGKDVKLVLLDLTMPIMSGEETLQHIKSRRPDLKVVLSSGFNRTEAVAQFTGKGLSGFLQKPYTSRSLAETVQMLIASDVE